MNKKFYSIVIALLIGLVSTQASAQKKFFSGIYTIGGSNANYQTIQRALSDLLATNSEVIGRVTFNIRPGVYLENLTLKPYNGASAKNFVVFKSETGKASDVLIKHPGDNTLYNNQVIRFEGCSYYTLQDLTIENDRVITASNQFASAIHFTYNRDTKKPAEYNTVNRCVLKVDSIYTVFNGNTIPIIASDINNTSVGEICANYNLISNNTIYGGTFGIRLLGKNSVQPGKGNRITNNKIYKSYSGMDIDFNNIPLISLNQINCRFNPNEAQFGIRVRNASGNFSFHGNVIKDYGTFGIFLYNVNGGAAAYIYNNMISGSAKSTYSRGIHVELSKSLQFYHNSIYYVSGNSTEKAAMVVENTTALPSTKISIKNNIFFSSGGAVPIIIRSTTSIDTLNYNCYFNATNTTLGIVGGTARNSLAALKAATAKDGQSLNVNPNFASPTSLRMNSKQLIRRAAVLSFITFDFENHPRDPETPDIGADEVIRSAVDLEVFHLDKNFVPKEGTNILPVVIKNDGLLSLNGNKILVSYKVDNGNYTTPEEFTLQTLSKSYSKQIITLAEPWIIPSPGLYTLIIRVSPPVPNDTWQENDADTLSICVGLNGTYTINGPVGNKNYPTFASAIAAFECGIGGPTVFNVYPGTYPSFSLPILKGATPTNTITFRSVTGNPADVIIQNVTSNQSNTNHHVIQIDGMDYVTVRNFTLNNTSANSFASGFHITEGSTNVTLDSCIVNVPTSSVATANIFPIIMSQKVKIDSGAVYSNITIKNCILRRGVSGVQMLGRNTGIRSQNVSVINTQIDSSFLYGINANFVNVGDIVGNSITLRAGSSVNSEAIRIVISKFNTKISANITRNAGTRALNLTSVEGITNVDISNNMFAGGYKTTGNGAGIYLNEVNKLNLYHNSVIYDRTSTAIPDNSSAFFLAAGANVSLFNNIFYNPAGGYAYYVTSQTSIRAANNNIYYTDADQTSGLYSFYGGDRVNLTALKAAMQGFESNSIEINPNFVSNFDLHTSNTALEGKGLYLGNVTKDFDGQDRNPLGPDIGADEFILHAKDLALLDIQPLVFSTDPNNISIKLMNLGSTSLNGSSIKLQYSSNGTTWLPAAGETYVIGNGGNASLANPYSTAVYTFTTPFNALPNNSYPFYVRVMPSDRIVGDPITINDTTNLLICTGLKSGTYTIGGTNPTYPDFATAMSAISCGITGPVVMNVRPGTYNERFTIGNPKNTSAINTITIKAENNDSSSVIINSTGVSSNTTRNTIRLNRSKFINLKHLTIQNLSSSIVGSAGIQITSESNNINITNCRFILDTASTSPNIFAITTSDSANLTVFGRGGSNLRIAKNYIVGGNLGIAIKGASQYIRDIGISIDSNFIEKVSSFGISTSNSDVLSITGNKIIMRKNQLSSTGLSMTINREDTRIMNNVIYNAATTGVTFNDVLTVNGVLFANNMIGGNFRLGAEGVGVTLTKVFPIKIYHNSISYDGNSVFGAGLKIDNDSRGVRLLNNSIANNNNGFCFVFVNQLSIDTSDNNNYFTKGVLFARVEGTDHLSMDEYRDVKLTDEKSVSVDPDYFTKTNLHLTNTFLDGGAIPLKEIPFDIDGEPRNAEFPDIGADEFLVRGDVEVVSIDSPLPSPEVYPSKVPVSITVRNKGLSKISGLNVKCYVNNVEVANEVIPVDEPYKPMLPSDLLTYEFTTQLEPTATGIYRLRVEAYLPDDIDLTNNSQEIDFKSSVSSIVDGEVASFVSPANSSVNQLTDVRVLIRNSGTVAIRNFNVNYRLRGGSSVLPIETESFGIDSISPLQSASFTFSKQIDCNDRFDRFIDVYLTDLSDDINQLNDTLSMYIRPFAGCFSNIEINTDEFMLTAPWPNPTSSHINFDLNLITPSDLSIELLDVLGHVVRTANYTQLNKGVNHVNMNVADLAPGIYYTRVLVNDTYYTNRVLISK
jgi:trimeric autotransporter adhesin